MPWFPLSRYLPPNRWNERHPAPFLSRSKASSQFGPRHSIPVPLRARDQVGLKEVDLVVEMLPDTTHPVDEQSVATVQRFRRLTRVLFYVPPIFSLSQFNTPSAIHKNQVPFLSRGHFFKIHREKNNYLANFQSKTVILGYNECSPCVGRSNEVSFVELTFLVTRASAFEAVPAGNVTWPPAFSRSDQVGIIRGGS